MATPDNELKRALRAEGARSASRSAELPQMPALGAFLNAALADTGRTRDELARQMDTDPLLVEGVLDGLLPDTEMDDQLLLEFSRALDLEPNLLRAILGRRVQHEARK